MTSEQTFRAVPICLKTRSSSRRFWLPLALLDTGTQTSLLEAGNYIATIEHRQGLKVACLEEVALRMGFIDCPHLEKIIERLPKGEYRDYLRLVCEED